MRYLKNHMFDCAVGNVSILVDKMVQLSVDDNMNEMDMFELFGKFTLQPFNQKKISE